MSRESREVLAFVDVRYALDPVGSASIDPANWRRLRLFLDGFAAVTLIAVRLPGALPGGKVLPASVRVREGHAGGSRRGIATWIWRFARITVRFGWRARRAGMLFVLYTGDPIAYAGLFLAVVTGRPLTVVMIGSAAESFRTRSSRYADRAKAFFARRAERLAVDRASLLLVAGVPMAIRLGRGVPFSTSDLRAADIGCTRDTCQGARIRWITVGAVNYEKGIDTLLRALSLCRARDPRHELTLVGACAESFPLADLIRSLGLTGAVDAVGAVDRSRVRALLDVSDIFVFLSRHEGMPKAPLEALAAALPVVATGTGADAYIEDGRNGLLVSQADAAGAAQAVLRLVSDSALRRRIIAAGVETARALTYDAGVSEVEATMTRAFPGLACAGSGGWSASTR